MLNVSRVIQKRKTKQKGKAFTKRGTGNTCTIKREKQQQQKLQLFLHTHRGWGRFDRPKTTSKTTSAEVARSPCSTKPAAAYNPFSAKVYVSVSKLILHPKGILGVGYAWLLFFFLYTRSLPSLVPRLFILCCCARLHVLSNRGTHVCVCVWRIVSYLTFVLSCYVIIIRLLLRFFSFFYLIFFAVASVSFRFLLFFLCVTLFVLLLLVGCFHFHSVAVLSPLWRSALSLSLYLPLSLSILFYCATSFTSPCPLFDLFVFFFWAGARLFGVFVSLVLFVCFICQSHGFRSELWQLLFASVWGCRSDDDLSFPFRCECAMPPLFLRVMANNLATTEGTIRTRKVDDEAEEEEEEVEDEKSPKNWNTRGLHVYATFIEMLTTLFWLSLGAPRVAVYRPI